jgi:hypothetical protein
VDVGQPLAVAVSDRLLIKGLIVHGVSPLWLAAGLWSAGWRPGGRPGIAGVIGPGNWSVGAVGWRSSSPRSGGHSRLAGVG